MRECQSCDRQLLEKERGCAAAVQVGMRRQDFPVPHPSGYGAVLTPQQSSGAGSTAILGKALPPPPEMRVAFCPGRDSSLPPLHSVLQFLLLGTTRCLIIFKARLPQKNDMCLAQNPPSLKISHKNKSQTIFVLPLEITVSFLGCYSGFIFFPLLTQPSCSCKSELKLWCSSSEAATPWDRLRVLVASLPSGL